MTEQRGAGMASGYSVGVDKLSLSVAETGPAAHDGLSRGTTVDASFLAVLKDAFAVADAGNHGSLDHAAAYIFWQHVFPGMPEWEVRQIADEIYQDIDPNGDMHISWYEIENYFAGNPSEWTEVDRMLSQNTLARPPTFKEALWYVVEVDTPRYSPMPASLNVLKTLMTTLSNLTILVSITSFIVESMPSNHEEAGSGSFFQTEAVCIALFTGEFIIRMCSCPTLRAYWASPFTWIDILAILPFYINIALGHNQSSSLVVLRVLRLFRLFRLLKLGRNLETVSILNIAIGRTFLPLLVSMVGINAIATILFASLITSAEHIEVRFDRDRQRYMRLNDSQFADAGQEIDFQSIPDSMWWAWVTLTTVGYGDMYPRTAMGKGVASVAMLLGIIIVGIPLTLLASSYEEVMQELRCKKKAKARSKTFQEKILDYRRIHGAVGVVDSGLSLDPIVEMQKTESVKALRESVQELRQANTDAQHMYQSRVAAANLREAREAREERQAPQAKGWGALKGGLKTKRALGGAAQRSAGAAQRDGATDESPPGAADSLAMLEKQMAAGFASLEHRVARQEQVLASLSTSMQRVEGMLERLAGGGGGGVMSPAGATAAAAAAGATPSPPPMPGSAVAPVLVPPAAGFLQTRRGGGT